MFSKLILVFVAILCIHRLVYSQYSNSLSPEALGQGGVGVTQTSMYGAALNPASSANFSYVVVGIYYYLPYHISELSYQNVLGIVPTNYGVFSAFIQHCGLISYQENRFAVNFSREVLPGLSAGFQLNVQHVFQQGRKSMYQAFSGIGILYTLHTDVHVGLLLQNSERSAIKLEEELKMLPSLFVLGVRWDASDHFNIIAEVEKQVNYNSIKKLGLQYSLNNKIKIRTGVLGKPVNYTMGLGFSMSPFYVDVGMVQHSILGFSSGIGILFKPTKNQ
jgi:hypothetical protein